MPHALRLGPAIALCVLFGCAPGAFIAPPARDTLPVEISDALFRRLMTELSEPGGIFASDNFTSNEASYAPIVSALRTGPQHGVYLGVGPEQNFSYIAATRPRMAFVIDIRRQAIVQHLMYKAIFELANDRADFISLLFSKPRPAGLSATSPIADIWDAFRFARTDSLIYARNYERIHNHLTARRGIVLSPQDSASLHYVYEAFYWIGPSISFSGYGPPLPISFTTLSLAADGDSARSFLATDDAYRIVKEMHHRNMIVPVVGDFAGPNAIKAVAGYLRSHRATISTFYVSSVEGYLAVGGGLQRFYENVATLPVTPASVFVRPPLPRAGPLTTVHGRWNSDGVWASDSSYTASGSSYSNVLCPIHTFIMSWRAGRVQTIDDVYACRR